MKFLNKELVADLERGSPINLNLGVGQRPKAGFYGLDLVEMEGVDVVADLNEGLPALPDDSVREINTQHVLEHIDNFMGLMRELHRVVRADGKLTITVPHFSNVFGFSDPTHVRFFGLYSMYYFCDADKQPERKVPTFYSDVRFEIESIFINFYRDGIVDRVLGKLMSVFVNRSISAQHFYERRLSSLYHADEITYVIKPVK